MITKSGLNGAKARSNGVADVRLYSNDLTYFGGFAWDQFEVWYPIDSFNCIACYGSNEDFTAGVEYDPTQHMIVIQSFTKAH